MLNFKRFENVKQERNYSHITPCQTTTTATTTVPESQILLLQRHFQFHLKEFWFGMAGKIVWSDEKIFTVEFGHNQKNDRILERNVEEILYNPKTVYQTMKPTSVMVWAAVSKISEFPLIFIDQNAKIKAKYHVENILEPMLKSV